MTVFENPDRYVVLFPQMQNLYEAHMLKDGTYVRVYCHPQVSETNIENLFHAIRLFFLFTAQRTDCLQSTQLLFSIREKHGCFPVIPEWENPHTLLCGMSFLTHRT